MKQDVYQRSLEKIRKFVSGATKQLMLLAEKHPTLFSREYVKWLIEMGSAFRTLGYDLNISRLKNLVKKSK